MGVSQFGRISEASNRDPEPAMSLDLHNDLANALSLDALGHPYDPESMDPETLEIEALLDLVDDYALGDITLAELTERFAEGSNFDIVGWVAEMEEIGEFAPSEYTGGAFDGS